MSPAGSYRDRHGPPQIVDREDQLTSANHRYRACPIGSARPTNGRFRRNLAMEGIDECLSSAARLEVAGVSTTSDAARFEIQGYNRRYVTLVFLVRLGKHKI